MGTEYIETAVVGGGQQGCSVAGSLARLGYHAVVFERGEIGQTWARERWESLTVNTPNRTVTFPGMPYDGDDPEGYMPAREVAQRLRRYVAETGVEVREHTAVRSVEAPVEDPVHPDARFRLHLENGDTVEARNVVAALGGYSSPRLPELTARIDPSVTQLHTRYYRNPQSLPPGAVLVVGSGNSGQQIAEDLRDAGREVYLAVGKHKTSPRRYRGAQVLDWLQLLPLEGNLESASGGRGDSPVLPGVSVLSGKGGGQELSLAVLVGKGVHLVGTVRGAQGTTLQLEDNVRAIAQAAARAEDDLLRAIDTAIEKYGLVVPERTPVPAFDPSLFADYGDELDLTANNITAIIWATGFVPDYAILPPTALEDNGMPVHRAGTGALPGLYYAGLPEGGSVMPLLIASTRDQAERVARGVHLDNTLRHRSPAALGPLWT
ncbi:putative flavoprotein involved in K+ transport [Streptomyces sp. 1114.5]|uniref:flavin-containing monooxygenase n=1 Tax=unclassified Streptomyces TaxID=2593676 RepID=UPI000BC91530|nr:MULTISPECIES: NAD(P)/FAD-dependent oxidoreductase [unclassified Streptomyces]RKT11381.1 putative flavoprotein involved in K+ transport [Streptomyces sp. 1114.5]SOB81256.1 putative flavoprotein involved in K+ transport [Streptomyces sp. 1331.2]